MSSSTPREVKKSITYVEGYFPICFIDIID